MKFSEVFQSYVAEDFNGTEVTQVIAEFMRHIPGRVLQMDFDTSKSNKQGIKDGERIYKLGLDLANSIAFVEFLENLNQGQPTMAIYADRAQSFVTISGWQANKRLFMRYFIADGKVKKSVQIN